MARIVREPIDSAALLDSVREDSDGGLALFVGTVRDHNRGRRVLYLAYEAYEEMAVSEMERIAGECRKRFAIHRIEMVHRIGRLEIGEASVAVAVSAAHRSDAFDACRHAIDTLKERVPIWKREVFEGGEVWIEGAGETPRLER